MNNVLKKIWFALASLIILMAVFSSVFRSLTPWATQYKEDVEQHLSVLIGQPVSIEAMETGWYWFQPVLKLKQVTLGPDPKQLFHVSQLLVGINLFKSLWNWHIEPGVLYIDDMHLSFREKGAHWTINGISTDALHGNDLTSDSSKWILIWLSQQERLIIKHVTAYFYFNDGGLIPVNVLNLSVVNSGGRYKFKGDARLEQTNTSDFHLLGDGYFDPEHFDQIEGHFYFSAKNVVPAQWQSLFPKASQHIEGGKGNIELWVDVHAGAVSLVQAQIKLKRLAWRLLSNQNSQLIQSFFANLSWKPDPSGWQLHADKIKMRIGGVRWPENQLLVKYIKDQQSYQLFVGSIIVESLLTEAINWPQSMHNLLEMAPHGILHDTQVVMKEQRLNYVLTRFSGLGWNAKGDIPEIKNLSGVLNWQPEEGRLELDSEKILIAANGYPVQQLSVLSGYFDWKELSDGLRISADRFVLSQPDLTLSAQGAVDQVTSDSIGSIRLNAEFSGKNFQQWMRYLPQKMMKPKLYSWLRYDLKRIAEASGTLTLNGMAKDFPFDNGNGEFSISSHASGGDLYINKKWPMITDLEGYIRFHNRDFSVDIVNADFQGVVAKKMNLRIDGIGNDKENMLVSGSIDGSLQKMVNYVMASPLKKQLTNLSLLALQGDALLNLNLEVPLYPEKDDVLAKGELTLKKNTIEARHEVGNLSIENVNGVLYFTEKGVNESSLTASAEGQALTINVHSVKTPKPGTTITFEGICPVELLKSSFKLPVLTVLQGSFLAKAVLTLTDKASESAHIVFNSSLEGVSVDLPTPLGKKSQSIAPLEVSLDFNSSRSIRLRANYNAHLSADFTFKNSGSGLDFDSGQLRLGSAHAVNQNQPGLAVVGQLKGFDFNKWKNVYKRFSGVSGSTFLPGKLRRIDVTVDKVNFLQQRFDGMAVKAKILSNKIWSLALYQKNIHADLMYHIASNEISGHVRYLHLDKINKQGAHSASELSKTLNPGHIPHLNLRIDDFSIGAIQIGDMTFKSRSAPDRWLLSYCRIDSPVYQINVQGEWTQKNGANQTRLDLKLNLTDLAKTLERWDISPVVKAKKGYVEFRGGWNDSLLDFSLAKLNGRLYLQLKNGLITHLSQETEEKLDLGKLLSILSLQTIPRRLQLDFSDLAHQGYSFDIFQGNFNLRQGVMGTQDSYIDGPVAYAEMKGSLDLAKRVYDLNLGISPHITASLPIVATIAGGPVAGVATWVATKIINQEMQKISAYSYKISGPWNQPVVQQISIVKQIMHK